MPRTDVLNPAAGRSNASTPDISPTRRVSFHSSIENFRKQTLLKAGGGSRSSSTDPLRAVVGEPRGRAQAEDNGVAANGTSDETTAIVSRSEGRTSEGDRNYSTISGKQASPPQQTTRRRMVGSRSTGAEGHDAQSGDNDTDSPGRWKRWAEKYGSVELENKGSVARDHLALERTFLAWLRTSLSFASIGIAITQLFRLNTTLNQSAPTAGQIRLQRLGQPLGATFLAVGIVTLVLGFHRYFESQHYVIRGKFPASRGSVIILSFIAGLLIIASFVVILVVNSAVKHPTT